MNMMKEMFIIKCPNCGSNDVDVYESEIGCEYPVNAVVIKCNVCTYTHHLFEIDNCIPINNEDRDNLIKLSTYLKRDINNIAIEFIQYCIKKWEINNALDWLKEIK